MSLKDIVVEFTRGGGNCNRIISEKNASLSFQVGADQGIRAKFGAMEIIDTYDEKYLVGYPVSERE